MTRSWSVCNALLSTLVSPCDTPATGSGREVRRTALRLTPCRVCSAPGARLFNLRISGPIGDEASTDCLSLLAAPPHRLPTGRNRGSMQPERSASVQTHRGRRDRCLGRSPTMCATQACTIASRQVPWDRVGLGLPKHTISASATPRLRCASSLCRRRLDSIGDVQAVATRQIGPRQLRRARISRR